MSFSSSNRLSGSLGAQSLRDHLEPICVALQGSSVADLLRQAYAALEDTTFLEFRLDSLPEPAAALHDLEQFLLKHPNLTAIATCRRLADGGQFGGTVQDELKVLTQSAKAGFRIVDLALASAESLSPSDLAHLRSTGVAVLISHHDFEATPDLSPLLDAALRLEPDLIKIVTTATRLSDNLRMLDLVRSNSEKAALIGICMGETGMPSRILALAAGSPFTFASGTMGLATAPGQIGVQTMRSMYRVPDLNRRTKLYGVLGNPVRHSLSPRMLNHAFSYAGIEAAYLPLCSRELGDIREVMLRLPLWGMSVTMPHKQSILSVLDEVDPLTREVGACNTVVRTSDDRLHGFNTDVIGITRPLLRRLHSLQGARILVLGAGGAARAAVFGLRAEGADVVLHNRHRHTAEQLAMEAGATVIDREAIRGSGFDVIVNTTPVGMAGHPAESPLAAEELRAPLVFDLIYNPLETPLLKAARERGLATISGVEMFVQQGARQYELWTGEAAPEDEMRRVVMETLSAMPV